MNIHKNARLTPHGRELIVRQVASGQAPKAAARAAGVCPRTVGKWVARYDAFASNVFPIIEALRASGVRDLRGLAEALNSRGVRTARGGRWHVSNVKNVIDRQLR